MRYIRLPLLVLILGAGFLWRVQTASAQAIAKPKITLDSFTGIYHLSRDSQGLSLLTSEETIIAEFPGSGNFSGIRREVPNRYQGKSVSTKILNVTDAAGNPVPFKTSTSGDNLVLVTGDPQINLFGIQTFRISYQTKGVVNLGNSQKDEFLLNVNGRGWDQPFARVDAIIHIPNSFSASLKGDPNCYLALDNTNNNSCQISTKKSSQESVISSRAVNLVAHQALVVKMEFHSSTFTDKGQTHSRSTIILGVVIVIATSVPAYIYLSKRR